MAKYLLIESRDPQEASAVGEYVDLAKDLKGAGGVKSSSRSSGSRKPAALVVVAAAGGAEDG